MIIVFILIAIIVGVAGTYIYKKTNFETLGMVLQFGGASVGVLSFLIGVVFLPFATSTKTIDEKIKMYQEENTKIEMQIAESVKNYQQYETDIIEDVTKENVMALVTLYPELKANELIAKQIEVYVENNTQIKYLKDDKIDINLIKWWLYFGGD